MLKNHNDLMTEEKIRSMPHEELVEAVIRLLNVPPVRAEDWLGPVYNPDWLADAFRGRNKITL